MFGVIVAIAPLKNLVAFTAILAISSYVQGAVVANGDAAVHHAVDGTAPSHDTRLLTHAVDNLPRDNPKTDIAKVFDHMYILTVRGCEHRAQLIESFARAAGFEPEVVIGVHYDDVDLHNPPIPIRDVPDHDTVPAGQVGCFASHYRVWLDAVKNNYSRVMILEDDVFFTNSTIPLLPAIFQSIDKESGERNLPWHYLFFRRAPLYYTAGEEVWSQSPSGHPITRAVPSWGTACYALSSAGAHYLVDNLSNYMFPVDVQVAEAQRSDPSFIALSACSHDDFRCVWYLLCYS